MNCSRLLTFRYSLASFNSRVTILHLLGSKILATDCAAFLPGSSLSKHKTTVSNLLRYSNACLQFSKADAAPFFIETVGYFPFICQTDMASISPSHTVIYLPPLENIFSPNNKEVPTFPSDQNLLSCTSLILLAV